MSKPQSVRPIATQVVPEQPVPPVTVARPVGVIPIHRRSNFLPILLSALLGLALIGGLIGVALGNRAPVANRVPPTLVEAVEGESLFGINPAVGIPIDGSGALTEAVAAPVIIDIYSDFSCPFCANFEATYAEQLMQLAEDPNVQLRWHPVAVLAHGDFPTNAGVVFLEIAASHPEYVWAMNDFLLSNQQQLSALSGQELVDAINSTDLNIPPFETILATHGPLLDQFTATFRQIGATGVPHILVNGQQWSPGGQPWPNISLVEAAQAAQS